VLCKMLFGTGLNSDCIFNPYYYPAKTGITSTMISPLTLSSRICWTKNNGMYRKGKKWFVLWFCRNSAWKLTVMREWREIFWFLERGEWRTTSFFTISCWK